MCLDLPENIITFLCRKGLISHNAWRAELLAGDGSNRRFFRIRTKDNNSFLVVLPAGLTNSAAPDKGLAEARAAYRIGRHLQSREVPVPEIIDFDPQTGIIVFEDLGDTLLYDKILVRSAFAPEIKQHYREAVEILVHMQVLGGNGFDSRWCWDTAWYDQQLMLEKESAYFQYAFCKSYLGIRDFPPDLAEEFQLLADRASSQPCDFFLHRDFQSRNLMVYKGKIKVIDFQGGRFGPLGYDLASLLIDPYAGLSEHDQEDLLEHYLSLLADYIPVDRRAFINGYTSLLLQRNLQIVGAFAFLSKQQAKPFFSRYLRPATISLAGHLARLPGAGYPALMGLVENCLDLLDKKSETDK